jgi:hypothetical protein
MEAEYKFALVCVKKLPVVAYQRVEDTVRTDVDFGDGSLDVCPDALNGVATHKPCHLDLLVLFLPYSSAVIGIGKEIG